MALVIVGPQSLDTLEEWAHTYFAAIENKNLDAPQFDGNAFGACKSIYLRAVPLCTSSTQTPLQRRHGRNCLPPPLTPPHCPNYLCRATTSRSPPQDRAGEGDAFAQSSIPAEILRRPCPREAVRVPQQLVRWVLLDSSSLLAWTFSLRLPMHVCLSRPLKSSALTFATRCDVVMDRPRIAGFNFAGLEA